MARTDTVLCSPVRAPNRTYAGAQKDTPASDLGAAVIRGTLRRSGLAADTTNTVMPGQVIQSMNPAALEVAAGSSRFNQWSNA